MAAYRLVSRVVPTAPHEWQVIVAAITVDHDGAEARRDTLESSSEAEDRRDFLMMSLATELRARGHDVEGLDEENALNGASRARSTVNHG